jgi:RNA polymerase sigma-70 factor (ECF subfamily)
MRLRHRVGAQLAEDLVQETYLRAAVYLHAGEIRHPKALLLRIASNLTVDAQRRVRRADTGPEAAGAGAAFDAPGQTQAVLLKQVVLSLPGPLQEVFVLSRFGGLTYEQIGERLGVSVKTVEWRMSKALAHCAAQLRP